MNIRLIYILFLTIIIASCGNGEQKAAIQEKPKDNVEIQAQQKEVVKQPKSAGITEDYVNANRVIWQKPDMILELLGDLEGKTVADIGAGTGFFALRIAPSAGKVIAIDIEQRFIDYLDSVKIMELPESIQDRLEPRLATARDSRLAKDEADIVIIVNTFMYIQQKTEYLKNLKDGIAEGGKLLIVDFKKKRTPIGPPSQIRLPLFELEEILYKAGYNNIQANDTALDYQYILIAEK